MQKIEKIKTIAARLKAARKEAGYKHGRRFALANNIPLTTYWQHENAKREMSFIDAAYYCEILNINLYWLYDVASYRWGISHGAITELNMQKNVRFL